MKHVLRTAVCLFAAVSAALAADLRIGMIGLDTSHCIEFTRRFNKADDKNFIPGGKVVAAYKGGSPDVEESWSRVEGYTERLQKEFGVKIVETIEELCGQVDVVMLESVDGRPHLAQAKPVLKARKPLFIDKPVAGSLRDAIEIYRLAKEYNVPVFSSSSLRYYPTVTGLAARIGEPVPAAKGKPAADAPKIGRLKGVISVGPAHMEPHHPDLFWYGIHPTEAMFAVMGTGCESVSCSATADATVVTGVWKDGKTGVLYGNRSGGQIYSLTLLGTAAVAGEKLAGDYTPFLREVMTFFQTGKAPVSPEETLEIFAFMTAAQESREQGGCTVKLADMMQKHGR